MRLGVLELTSTARAVRPLVVVSPQAQEVVMSTLRAASRTARLVVVASAALLGACSRNQVETDPGNVPAAVVFSNESLSQSDLFAVIAGSSESRKLGTVFAGRTETLRLPYSMAQRGNVSLVARMLDGGLVSSGMVSIRPGDTVHVELPMSRNMLMFLP